MLTENEANEIKSLWHNKEFHGAFSGAHTFRQALSHVGKNYSAKDVASVLHSIPAYVDKIRKVKISKTRPYRVRGTNKVWEVDIAYMNKEQQNGRTVHLFILSVDIFSRKLYTKVLIDNTKASILEAFGDFFSQNEGRLPEEVQGDYEFEPYKTWLRSKGIYYRTLYRRNKAAIAEMYIYQLKRRMYAQMAEESRTDWFNLLQNATNNINNTPLKLLGGLKPADIHSEKDDPKVWAKAPNRPTVLHWQEKLQNQEKYDGDSSKLHEGDVVLYQLSTKKKKFEQRSFHTKV